LVEEHYGRFLLTRDGEKTLANDELFVPERGTWTLWFCTDDLLRDTDLLRVDPWREPSAGTEQNTRAAPRNFTDLTAPFLRGLARDPAARLATPGRSRARVGVLDRRSERLATTTLALRWEVHAKRVTLHGALDGEPLEESMPAPDITVDAVLDALMTLRADRGWDRKRKALAVAFDDASPEERETMLRDARIEAPYIGSAGSFDDVIVRVPLCAASAHDAQRWAAWRQQERVRDYATAERFATWTAEAAEPFADRAPSMPTRSELARAAWQNRSADARALGWHLVAAEDWDL
jgi:hypothetical protein